MHTFHEQIDSHCFKTILHNDMVRMQVTLTILGSHFGQQLARIFTLTIFFTRIFKFWYHSIISTGEACSFLQSSIAMKFHNFGWPFWSTFNVNFKILTPQCYCYWWGTFISTKFDSHRILTFWVEILVNTWTKFWWKNSRWLPRWPYWILAAIFLCFWCFLAILSILF